MKDRNAIIIEFVYNWSDGRLMRTFDWTATSPDWVDITPVGCGEVYSFGVYKNCGSIIDANGNFYYSINIKGDVPTWEKAPDGFVTFD